MHLVVARPAWWFTVLPDEAGYLGNARWLVGGPSWPMGQAPRYGIGASLAYVPAVLLGQDARSVVAGAGEVNAIVLAFLAPLLAATARRFTTCGPAVALAAGGVGALVPAAVLGGTVMWAEPAVLVAVAAFAFGATRPTWWWAVLCGALPWIHLRLSPFALGALVLVVVRRHWPLLVTLVTTTAVGGLGQWAVERARWDSTVGPPVSDGLRTPGSAAVQLLGETWYLVASTGGLVVLGVLALWPRLRRRDPAALVLAGSGAALVALSAVSSAASAHRPEQYVYGRYVDALAPLLVAFGVTWLARTGIRSRRSVALGVIAAVTGAALAVVVARGSEVFDGRWQTTQVIGLAWLGSAGGVRTIWFATAAAVLVAVGWSTARAPVAVTVVAVALAASSVAAWLGPLADRRDQYAGWTVPEALDALDVDAVAYDRSAASPVGQWAYPLLFDGAEVVAFDDEPPAGIDAVVGSLDRPPFGRGPDVRDERFGLGVWLTGS